MIGTVSLLGAGGALGASQVKLTSLASLALFCAPRELVLLCGRGQLNLCLLGLERRIQRPRKAAADPVLRLTGEGGGGGGFFPRLLPNPLKLLCGEPQSAGARPPE